MTFRWMGPNAIEDSEESGSMALSPVLKNHNAYLVHNETLYCDKSELWRGMYIYLKIILSIGLHFVKEITAVWRSDCTLQETSGFITQQFLCQVHNVKTFVDINEILMIISYVWSKHFLKSTNFRHDPCHIIFCDLLDWVECWASQSYSWSHNYAQLFYYIKQVTFCKN